MGNRSSIEKMMFISICVALSAVLGFVDNILSVITLTPAAKIGFSNIIILTAIYYLDFNSSLTLIVLKSIVMGFIMGNFMAFMIGFSGTLLSFYVMYLLLIFKDKFSLIGISIAGSITHILGQYLVIYFFYDKAILSFLPYNLVLSTSSGILIGVVVIQMIKYLDQSGLFLTITKK